MLVLFLPAAAIFLPVAATAAAPPPPPPPLFLSFFAFCESDQPLDQTSNIFFVSVSFPQSTSN